MTNINNLRMFVRVYELGNMSAAARDLRVSAAVASSRIGELERHLGIRLFTRTTRQVQSTEQGRILYPKAIKVLEALEEAEAAVQEVTLQPRGSIFVAAPLGIGRLLLAPLVAQFNHDYPDVHVRMRLTDRKVDMLVEGLDLAFALGDIPDSDLRIRNIADCPRVLCAAPDYIARRGHPLDGGDLMRDGHACLLLRFPGSTEFRWTLNTSAGPQRFDVNGPFAADDGQVLLDWALNGHGIINRPLFDVAPYLADGRLVAVCENSPPMDASLACLFAHKRKQDPKIRLFMDFVIGRMRDAMQARTAMVQLPR